MNIFDNILDNYLYLYYTETYPRYDSLHGVPLASKPKFVKDENEFFVREIHGTLLPRRTVWTECSQVVLCLRI